MARSFTTPLAAHALAVFTCPALGPVNTNSAYNLIPKNEIIWHWQPPIFAAKQEVTSNAERTKGQKARRATGEDGLASTDPAPLIQTRRAAY
jgi:hypothetical protein